MLEPELQNIIETHKNLSELLEDDYLIRDRIFTGNEVLEILGQYFDKENSYYKLEEEKEEISNELDKLKDKHKRLRNNVKNLAVKYDGLRDEKDIKHSEKMEKEIEYRCYEKIGLIIKELKQYKGEFVDRLLKKISEI